MQEMGKWQRRERTRMGWEGPEENACEGQRIRGRCYGRERTQTLQMHLKRDMKKALFSIFYEKKNLIL